MQRVAVWQKNTLRSLYLVVVENDEQVVTATTWLATVCTVVPEEGVDIIDTPITRSATTCAVGVVVDVIFGQDPEC